MLLLDVNVVLAAHRTDNPHNAVARPWLVELGQRARPFGVPTTVWASFLRLTTNRRIFTTPSPVDDAFAFIDAVVAQPNHLGIEPTGRHLAYLRQAIIDGQAAGDLVPDAVLVTIAAEHGAAVASFDRDFARFPGIEWIRPSIDDPT